MSVAAELSLKHILERGIEHFNLIDVRSEGEFIEDTIPTSVNIPLLNNEERAKVGTCYVQIGPKEARLLGVDLVSPKLPQLIRSFLDIKDKRLTVVFCWRGGLRSASTAGLLKLAGLDVSRIEGGYKSFRNHVNSFFQNFSPDYSFINLYGPTGCGKTAILRQLDGNVRVLDLEKAAAHKGSSFGEVDEPEYQNVTQKNFETKIWYKLYREKEGAYLVEGESMKIGKVSVPKSLFSRMKSGVSVVAEVPLDARISFTVDNYKPELYKDEILRSLSRLKKYIGNAKAGELAKLLDAGDYESFTKILLESYYDPLYMRSIPDRPDYIIRYENIEEGKQQLEQIYMENNNT
ncbi:tRNA 2-selenouridine(34) synthase MnmH [Seleniivibrio sp.]|uniref:tRNA 2-selenouridine(34) synthase MnmH n=1 Tax=Seleniivibrio sp. TaxID=2898801 RepID=UPI0025DF6717|nr:tRNA 2-selenouridine(34) synthase MnmH [Seleniivibrio sp.]MCD8554077.1 tRNA 2-selenouridine(34) synthase MnmH [Seleniivibrio sp.]